MIRSLFLPRNGQDILRLTRLGIRMVATYLGFGCGPDFMIIGAQKAGTTSLYKYISDLGDNFVAPQQKELYFFTENYSKGLAYYKAKFPLFRKPGDLTGEATPDYLLYPNAPSRIKKHFPDVRIVVILRDPALRAYSQYQFQNGTDRTHAYDPLSFNDAVSCEPERYTAEDIDQFNENFKYYSYMARGRYADQLTRWFKLFPRNRIWIMELNELRQNPEKEINGLFKFLGLRRKQRGGYQFQAANKGPGKKSEPATEQNLRQVFDMENRKLFRLLGKRFNWPGPEDEAGR